MLVGKFRECGELVYGSIFIIMLKGDVYKSYVEQTMLYGCKV